MLCVLSLCPQGQRQDSACRRLLSATMGSWWLTCVHMGADLQGSCLAEPGSSGHFLSCRKERHRVQTCQMLEVPS